MAVVWPWRGGDGKTFVFNIIFRKQDLISGRDEKPNTDGEVTDTVGDADFATEFVVCGGVCGEALHAATFEVENDMIGIG